MEKGAPKIQTLKEKGIINLLNILDYTPEDDDYNYARKTILTPHPILHPSLCHLELHIESYDSYTRRKTRSPGLQFPGIDMATVSQKRKPKSEFRSQSREDRLPRVKCQIVTLESEMKSGQKLRNTAEVSAPLQHSQTGFPTKTSCNETGEETEDITDKPLEAPKSQAKSREIYRNYVFQNKNLFVVKKKPKPPTPHQNTKNQIRIVGQPSLKLKRKISDGPASHSYLGSPQTV
ncbi:hypothetical protein llap_1407 [Limosa lapponica baueri]|uniref:Uncharacterized protein n=1 Tax=Limosa lapponica baueri TaxID=1758121 RepID=A0A2I0UQI3_LIMLA|nr:hypothetical protein llap_1407 [Limosa lapponica baueri]